MRRPAVVNTQKEPTKVREVPRFAVLFKTHFWDDYCDRQFRRLYRHVGAGDLFVVVDETRGPVTGIPHDRVVRMTETTAADEGYLHHPKGNLFWWNTDY